MGAKYKNFIVEILKTAIDIANRNFGKVSAVVKGEDNNQVLTETDIEIGKSVISKIKQNYSNYNIIDEEVGVIDNGSQFTWVIDPIDGTSNFANGVPLYCTMVGLLKENVPIAGGVALPPPGEIYVAEKGFGAFCNEKKIHVTSEVRLLSTLVAYTLDGHQENPDFTRNECRTMAEIILNIRNLRNAGSCFDAVMVAKGKYGAYLNLTSKIWDNVAQQILVEEAGGIYTDFWGKPIDYTNPLAKAKDNFTLCAAPPILHKQLQDIIHKNTKA